MNDHEVARHIARRAGDLLAAVRDDSPGLPSRELAALGDRAAHELCLELFREFRPDDFVLSEEGELDPTRNTQDRLWIIDPLDGTSHYSSRGSDYAVHIALWERSSAQHSHITAASVYVPDTGVMLSMDDDVVPSIARAEAIRILVSRTRPPREIDKIAVELKSETGREIEVVPMGSVGAKVAHIIAGHADMYINTGGFHEWDIAAPLGVAHHYGLTVCDRDGNHLEFNLPDTIVSNAVITRPQFVPTLIHSLA